MKTSISFTDESVVWGEPDKNLDNSGMSIFLAILGALFIGIAAAFFHWSDTFLVVRPVSQPGADDGFNSLFVWGLIELLIVFGLCYLAFSSHFRLDAVEANAKGMDIEFSHIPIIAGDYVNERKFVPWGDVYRIEIMESEGSHWVTVALNTCLASGDSLFKFDCTGEEEAKLLSKKLQGIAGDLLTGPKR